MYSIFISKYAFVYLDVVERRMFKSLLNATLNFLFKFGRSIHWILDPFPLVFRFSSTMYDTIIQLPYRTTEQGGILSWEVVEVTRNVKTLREFLSCDTVNHLFDSYAQVLNLTKFLCCSRKRLTNQIFNLEIITMIGMMRRALCKNSLQRDQC